MSRFPVVGCCDGVGLTSSAGAPTNLEYSMARAYCACSRCEWGGLDIFSLDYHFYLLSPSLWDMAQYRLKYCLKGPLSRIQPTKFTVLCLFSIPIVLPSFLFIGPTCMNHFQNPIFCKPTYVLVFL